MSGVSSGAPGNLRDVVEQTLLGADRVLGLAPDTLLGAFNRAGVVSSADVHVALTLGRLAGVTDETTLLAVTLAVRAPRFGHVYADLSTARDVAMSGDVDEETVNGLPWPEPLAWVEAVATSTLVSVVDRVGGPFGQRAGGAPGQGPTRPLVLEGSALYLDRHWRDECAVAADLAARTSGATAPDAGPASQPRDRRLAALLANLFPGDAAEQRAAATTALSGRLAVIVGGPGTGKTTTVARTLAGLFELSEATGSSTPLVALAAPTGKAAARLTEAVRSEAEQLSAAAGIRNKLAALEAATVHRLLGSFGGGGARFRHNKANPLPHDVVVVDETSMLSLSLMARLVEAVRPTARLVLVGDPEQLVSVEAGVVLADVAGPVGRAVTPPTGAAKAPGDMDNVGGRLEASPHGAPAGIGECVVLLRTNHRFSGALAAFAEALRAGDADRALAALRAGDPDLRWEEVADGEEAQAGALSAVATEYGLRLLQAAGEGAEAALAAADNFRILCAHRHGPAGASTWNNHVETHMRARHLPVPGAAWYPGRPVIVTANDYGLRLFNGDVGVTVTRPDGGVAVAFRRGSEVTLVSPALLGDVATVYAMTIHRSQGSEFDNVAVLLPQHNSRVLTRELLYTAVTRARRAVLVVGSESALRAGIGRRVARASGLLSRLWGPGVGDQ